MKVITLDLGPFAANCVILIDEAERDAIVVDPGFEPEAILDTIAREHLRPRAIVLTHAHIDHVYGTGAVKSGFPDAPLLLHAADLPLYQNVPGQARMFGFPERELPAHDGFLDDGQILECGRASFRVRHAPGHSPGHVVLVHEDAAAPLAVVGDVLFAGSVGRTDLWGGSFPQLERSIREVLYRLPGATRVVCGHGPDTTIAEERAHNPFVAGVSGS